MDILEYSAVELSAAIREGKVTATDAMEAVLARIDAREKDINAYVTVDREQALRAAASVQEKIEKGELTGPLAGVPVAVEDNMRPERMLTTRPCPLYTCPSPRAREEARMPDSF